MAQDLKDNQALASSERAIDKRKCAGSVPLVGQFWRDTVNGDVLKINSFSDYTPPFDRQFEAHGAGTMIQDPPAPVLYAQCSCYPRGEYYMGIQEMKVVHFGTPRFQKVGWFKSLWYKLKLRRSQPLA